MSSKEEDNYRLRFDFPGLGLCHCTIIGGLPSVRWWPTDAFSVSGNRESCDSQEWLRDGGIQSVRDSWTV